MTNFLPLQKEWPQLYKHANFAELYVFTDPHTAIIKLRCFAELVVGGVYQGLNLPCDRNDGFFERLTNSSFTEIIDNNILGKIHAIRILGNKAAHGQSINSKDALALLYDAYLIGQWLFKTNNGVGFDKYPIYTEPKPPKVPINELTKENNRLEEQLNRAKEELNNLEKSEKINQIRVDELDGPLDEAKLHSFKKASETAAASFDLSPENTQKLIKLHDAFLKYNLTDGQEKLINNLADFLNSKDSQIFLLKGYAGTGKTFITKGLTEYFRAVGRKYVLAAPTGKAAKVIAKKTLSPAYTIHKTIYSFEDIIEYRVDNLDGSETYKFYAQLAVNEMPADTVYIIDEASMVSDIHQEEEFFRFGSGYLLRDFLKFVNLDHNDHKKKIIFIGDDAQLPPVGMKFSPALDNKYLYKKYGLESNSLELTDVVRQNADSGIIHNSTKLRRSLKTGVFNQIAIDLDYPDLKEVTHQNLMKSYLVSCNGKINGESIILAHSNADVAAYNRQIREHFFPNIKEITGGDKVISITNNRAFGFLISNGDFGLIKNVSNNIERRNITLRKKHTYTNEIEKTNITLTFREVEIGFKDNEGKPHFFHAIVLESLLYSDFPNLTSDERKALYQDFCIRHSNLKRGSKEFKDTLQSDPYFNALHLKFGYAITCHKAQGSEWNHVFVKCKTNQNQLSASYFRWFYTAITRTSDKLYLIDPPAIKLGSGLKPVSSPNGLFNNNLNSSISIHPPVEFDQEIIQQPNSKSKTNSFTKETYGIPPEAYFSLELLNRIIELIRIFNVNIQDVSQGQYKEIYFFQRNSEIARIDISYNGRGKITKIVPLKQTEFSLEIINLISSLNGTIIVPSTPTSSTSFKFEEEFMNDFHQRLCPLAEKKEITINKVEQMDWKQRYTFTQLGEIAVFDIFYNGRNQFTQYAPVRTACSSNALISDVQVMLTDGLNS